MPQETVLTGSESNIVQVGVVVKDLDKTLTLLTQLGLGPFENTRVSHPSATVRGEKKAYVVRIATAQQGAVQLELIEYQSGDTVQKDFLDEHGEGLHHILFQVKDLDKTLRKFDRQGLSVLQQDRFVGGGGMAYIAGEQLGGMVFELVQYPLDHEPGQGLVYV